MEGVGRGLGIVRASSSTSFGVLSDSEVVLDRASGANSVVRPGGVAFSWASLSSLSTLFFSARSSCSLRSRSSRSSHSLFHLASLSFLLPSSRSLCSFFSWTSSSSRSTQSRSSHSFFSRASSPCCFVAFFLSTVLRVGGSDSTAFRPSRVFISRVCAALVGVAAIEKLGELEKPWRPAFDILICCSMIASFSSARCVY